MDPHIHAHTRIQRRWGGEGGREWQPSLSCRMREGGWRQCARPLRRSHPAHPTAAATLPPTPSSPSLFPATQMASRRAHFISASYSRPAWRRKWKQWDTAVIRYRMLVASLNSHLYYLSASKSARASARLLVRLSPLSPSSPSVSWRPAPPRVSPGAYKEVASLPVQKECVKRQCRWRFPLLNEDFLRSREYFIIARPFFNS